MKLFGQLFKGKNTTTQDHSFWKTISSEEDLEDMIARSHHCKVAIFKHSTRCFISKTVLRNLEKEIENHISENQNTAEFYYLDLLAYRNLSNKIADTFGISHQSPQLIVVENGKAVNNASHQNISLSLMF